jgi:hypothetical protein
VTAQLSMRTTFQLMQYFFEFNTQLLDDLMAL